MDEREGNGEGRLPPHIHVDQGDTHGIVIPREVAVTPNETGIYVDTLADSNEEAERVLNIFADAIGAKLADPTERGSNRPNFFSSKNWGGSKWEPQGPKRNWGYQPPKDPRLN